MGHISRLWMVETAMSQDRLEEARSDSQTLITSVCFLYPSRQKFMWIDYEERPAIAGLLFSITKSLLGSVKK